MYWTITEIIREPNVIQRSKILKQFIKIASMWKENAKRSTIFFCLECCKEMKNFNSMFAIISGLDHKTVQRLQTTWERVPEKYKNIFEVNEYRLFLWLGCFFFLGIEILTWSISKHVCLSEFIKKWIHRSTDCKSLWSIHFYSIWISRFPCFRCAWKI
jgi:hypothetical protein